MWMRKIAGGQKHRSFVDFGARWRAGSVEEAAESRFVGLFVVLGRLWRTAIE